jgi:hypothetical protein
MRTITGPASVAPLADHHRFRFIVLDDDGKSEIYVEISGTAMACEPDALPSPLGEVVRTRGRCLVERAVEAGGELPERFVVGSESVTTPIEGTRRQLGSQVAATSPR